MSRRARRKTETLRRIEEAGWQLFTTRGYEATSTREIAEAADIAAGTLFNYFPEKRSLLIHSDAAPDRRRRDSRIRDDDAVDARRGADARVCIADAMLREGSGD